MSNWTHRIENAIWEKTHLLPINFFFWKNYFQISKIILKLNNVPIIIHVEKMHKIFIGTSQKFKILILFYLGNAGPGNSILYSKIFSTRPQWASPPRPRTKISSLTFLPRKIFNHFQKNISSVFFSFLMIKKIYYI